jgi:hypothetical protein
MADSPTEIINIQLGDILEFIAPGNEIFNQQKFFVKYIDNDKIKLINIDTQEPTTLNIKDGQLDESIEGVELLSRAEFPGYAKQNNLDPGVWVEIYFRGTDGVPFIITGLIINLEEDSIEIQTYPEDDKIYIDFAYKGIPENLPIEKIIIRAQPTPLALAAATAAAATAAATAAAAAATADLSVPEYEEHIGIDQNIIDAQLQAELMEGNQIEFGEDLDDIIIYVDVPESQKRYSIEKQTEDLLNELITDIPGHQRTIPVLNNIHTMIERYVQLRTIYSVFDANGNANIPQELNKYIKPIIKDINNFNKRFHWLLPISYNQKKLYNLDQTVYAEMDSPGIDLLKLGQVLESELTDYEMYKSSEFSADENKYAHLFQLLNQYITPFDNPLNINTSIVSQPVNTNILSIVNNLGGFESYVAAEGKVPKGEEGTFDKKHFLLETYTTGLTCLKNKELAPLTRADTITITSILTLDIPALLYSQIDLLSTNILKRSELNQVNFAYWKLLTQHTDARQLTINNFDNSDDSVDSRINEFRQTFFSGIREYILDEELYIGENKYEKFLNMIIPTNEEIFDTLKKYISNTVSMYSVIQFLEIFSIYHNDIIAELYYKIQNYVNSSIADYKTTFNQNYKAYNTPTKKEVPLFNNWLKILSGHKELYTIVLDAYGLTENNSNSELFNKIINTDFGRLFTIAIIRIDLDLQNTKLVDNFVQKYEQLLMEKQTEENTCKIISKKYTSLEALMADNNKVIYYDSDYDKTNYNLLKKFENKLDILPPEEYKQLLIDELTGSGLTDEEVNNEIDTLLLGKKIVMDGDYAILVLSQEKAGEKSDELETEKIGYYVRRDNNWIEVQSPIGGNILTDNKLFCNLQKDCMIDKDTCTSLNIVENKINEETLKAIYKEFDETYGEKEDDLRGKIDKILESSIRRIQYLNKLKTTEFYKYDFIRRKLADSIIDEETEDVLVVSPYEKLKDIILGQPDFVKKQNDIKQFVTFFTRKAFDIEDQYWLYCIKTGVKLFPTFISHLANVFISNGDYLYEQDLICTDQGTLSDDQEAWVDKYSGYFIKKIDFDTEEGFTEEGFKLKTREKMERDLGDAVLEQLAQPTTTVGLDNAETKKISNIINAITNVMSIDLSKERDFIIRQVMNLHKSIIPNQKQYDKFIEQQQKEDKKNIPTYQEAVDAPLLITTFVFILIAIQLSIPSIKSRKTFPGCIKSFVGYPTYDDDKTALLYIACVARGIRSNTPPWNSIKSLKDSKIAEKMEKIIQKNSILKISIIRERIKEKKRYLKTEKQDTIFVIIDQAKLSGFYPPLVPFKITVISNADSLKSTLIKNLKLGSYMQQDQILSIKSKIILFGLSIQEKIQKIVDKKAPLITNNASEPFLENACCDEQSTDIHKYFIDIDQSITTYNNIVTDMDNMLYDLNSLSRAPLFYDPNDTRYKQPNISAYFSKDTIYRAFIVFCKSKELALSDELRAVCGNPEDPYIEESIEEKIARLKAEGINYDENLMQKLLTIVNLKNSLKIDLTIKLSNTVQQLTDVLTNIKLLNGTVLNPVIPQQFVDKFFELLDRYSIKQDKEESNELRTFKNYLASQNKELSAKMIQFIKANSGLSKSKFQKFIDCIENINSFVENDDESINSEDETTYKMIYFIRNAINNLIDLFPNIILNQIDYSNVNIPKHWKLSQRHNLDIKEIIEKYYLRLKPFYGNPNLTKIFEIIQVKCRNIQLLVQHTPFFASIGDDKSNIYSIFDIRLTMLLYKYYMLIILDTYIKLIDTKLDIDVSVDADVAVDFDISPKKPGDDFEQYQIDLLKTATAQQKSQLEAEKEADDAFVVKDVLSAADEEIPELEGESSEAEAAAPKAVTFLEAATEAGDIKETSGALSKYLDAIMKIICSDKSAIDFNKKLIMEKILVSKEKEKDNITQYLKELTDEERDVENLFKSHKLEKWGKGLKKGLTQYVQENYDEEREALDKQMIKDRLLAENTDVTDQNKNIFGDELDAEAQLDEEIDNEVNLLTEYGGEDDNGPDGESDDGW